MFDECTLPGRTSTWTCQLIVCIELNERLIECNGFFCLRQVSLVQPNAQSKVLRGRCHCGIEFEHMPTGPLVHITVGKKYLFQQYPWNEDTMVDNMIKYWRERGWKKAFLECCWSKSPNIDSVFLLPKEKQKKKMHSAHKSNKRNVDHSGCGSAFPVVAQSVCQWCTQDLKVGDIH